MSNINRIRTVLQQLPGFNKRIKLQDLLKEINFLYAQSLELAIAIPEDDYNKLAQINNISISPESVERLITVLIDMIQEATASNAPIYGVRHGCKILSVQRFKRKAPPGDLIFLVVYTGDCYRIHIELASSIES